MSRVRYAFFTNTGDVRSDNEDGLLIDGRVVTGDMDCPESGVAGPFETPALFIVADGMGGCACGEVACRVLLEAIRDQARAFAGALGEEDDPVRLGRMVTRAHRRMNEMAEETPGMRGMGTAAAGVLVRKASALAFNVGDCRVYRCGDGDFRKVTHDHSVVQRLRDEGTITDEEMRVSFRSGKRGFESRRRPAPGGARRQRHLHSSGRRERLTPPVCRADPSLPVTPPLCDESTNVYTALMNPPKTL